MSIYALSSHALSLTPFLNPSTINASQFISKAQSVKNLIIRNIHSNPIKIRLNKRQKECYQHLGWENPLKKLNESNVFPVETATLKSKKNFRITQLKKLGIPLEEKDLSALLDAIPKLKKKMKHKALPFSLSTEIGNTPFRLDIFRDKAIILTKPEIPTSCSELDPLKSISTAWSLNKLPAAYTYEISICDNNVRKTKAFEENMKLEKAPMNKKSVPEVFKSIFFESSPRDGSYQHVVLRALSPSSQKN